MPERSERNGYNYGTTDKMTKVAVDLGYYDQAKFIKDFKEYAGITPNRYLKKIQNENYRIRVNRIVRF